MMAFQLAQVQPIPGGENLGDDLEEAGGKLVYEPKYEPSSEPLRIYAKKLFLN